MGVTMVGIHERSAREKIFSNQVAHILNDESQRKYIQAVKRLMSFAQNKYPNDPSKNIGWERGSQWCNYSMNGDANAIIKYTALASSLSLSLVCMVCFYFAFTRKREERERESYLRCHLHLLHQKRSGSCICFWASVCFLSSSLILSSSLCFSSSTSNFSAPSFPFRCLSKRNAQESSSPALHSWASFILRGKGNLYSVQVRVVSLHPITSKPQLSTAKRNASPMSFTWAYSWQNSLRKICRVGSFMYSMMDLLSFITGSGLACLYCPNRMCSVAFNLCLKKEGRKEETTFSVLCCYHLLSFVFLSFFLSTSLALVCWVYLFIYYKVTYPPLQ